MMSKFGEMGSRRCSDCCKSVHRHSFYSIVLEDNADLIRLGMDSGRVSPNEMASGWVHSNIWLLNDSGRFL